MSVNIRILRSDQQEFFADGKRYGEASWGITDIEGIGSAEFQNFTEHNAVGDGDIYTGNRIKSRIIEFRAVAKNPALSGVLRRAAASFFNPKYSFRIFVTYRGRTLWIDAVLDAVDIPSKHVQFQQVVKAEFLCPDPLFRSVDAFGLDIASIEPLWTFEEIDCPEWGGEPFDCFLYAQNVEVTNDGDTEAFGTAVIRATGTVQNPKITKGDAYVRLIDDLKIGDVVEIDIAKRTVKKNGLNILVKIDRTSDFARMAFDVGDNLIGYDADVGVSNMSVTMFYNKLYLGV